MKITRIFTVKKITWLLYIALFSFTILSIYSVINFYQINKFNKDINKGITPNLFKQRYNNAIITIRIISIHFKILFIIIIQY